MSTFRVLLQRLILPDAPLSSKYIYNEFIPAFVTDIYDGDTMTVKFFQSGDLVIQESVRLYGIDAPEVIVRDKKDTKVENLEEFSGRFVRDYVRDLVKLGNGHCFIKIHHESLDKYQRPLCSIYLESKKYDINQYPTIDECIDLNANLVKLKYAKPYFGGTKEPWNAEQLLDILGATNGFHNIEWDYAHKDFNKCVNEVLCYYNENKLSELYKATIDKCNQLNVNLSK